MELIQYILPYPYEAYNKVNRIIEPNFNIYKNKIYGWVEKNTINADISLYIESIFSRINYSNCNEYIKTWFLKHSDKLKYIGDFSGLSFGIIFDEEIGVISVRYPIYIEDEDRELYPLYDEIKFKQLQLLDMLEWMYTNCEFIPFYVSHESY